MKLIVVLGIAEYEKDLKNIFKGQKIPVFSELPIKGFKSQLAEEDMGWFQAGDNGVFSNLFFAFIQGEQAEPLLNAIKEFNNSLEGNNPFHAFLMNVEKFV